MCQRYIRKLDEVEAFQYNKENELPEWILQSEDIKVNSEGRLYMNDIEIIEEDYIVRNWRGDVYVATKEIFEHKYKPVELVETEFEEPDKMSLSDKIAEDFINRYCSKISIINIDIYEGFIGERIIIRIEDGNKKHFRKKRLKGTYWDIASVEEFERKVEGLVRDYAELQNKDKIYKNKKDILINKLLEDYHKYDRSDEFDK